MFPRLQVRASQFCKTYLPACWTMAGMPAFLILFSFLVWRVTGNAQEHAHGSSDTAAPAPDRATRPIVDVKSLKTTHGLKMALASYLDGDVSLTLDGVLDAAAWETAEFR